MNEKTPQDGEAAEKGAAIPRRARVWPAAVAASAFLHLAVVLVVGLLPGRAQRGVADQDRPSEVRWIELDEGDSGDVQFVSNRSASKTADSEEQSLPPFKAELVGPAYQHLLDSSSHLENGNNGPQAAPRSNPNGTPGSGQSGAGGATTSFFQIGARGHRIVYVIDASSSMGRNGAFAAARQELVASLHRLDSTTKFQVIVYNSQASCLLPRHPGWLTPAPDLLLKIEHALGTLALEGKTEHAPALRAAFRLQPDTIYLLTDADDLAADHLHLARQLNQHGTVIHAVELTLTNRQRTWMPLQALARQHGGQYQAVELR